MSVKLGKLPLPSYLKAFFNASLTFLNSGCETHFYSCSFSSAKCVTNMSGCVDGSYCERLSFLTVVKNAHSIPERILCGRCSKSVFTISFPMCACVTGFLMVSAPKKLSSQRD